MEARLPLDKLQRIRFKVSLWLEKKRARKRQILSLVGLLQHATKVVKPGRTFGSHMYKAAVRLKKLHHTTRLKGVQVGPQMVAYVHHLLEWSQLPHRVL